MNSFSVIRSTTMEVDLTAAMSSGTTLNFTNNQQLNQKNTALIYGIEVLTSEQMVVSPQGKNVFSTADYANILLEFYERSTQFIQDVPALVFNPATNYGIMRLLQPRQIDWTKSAIKATAAVGAANDCALVNIYYFYPQEDFQLLPEEFKKFVRNNNYRVAERKAKR